MAEEKHERRDGPKQTFRRRERIDHEVQKLISETEQNLATALEPVTIRGMNPFQRKQIYRHFEKTQEFRIKSYKDEKELLTKIKEIKKIQKEEVR